MIFQPIYSYTNLDRSIHYALYLFRIPYFLKERERDELWIIIDRLYGNGSSLNTV